MFPKTFFAGGYFPSAYFPPSGAEPVGAPPDYDFVFHVGTAHNASTRMERMPRSLGLYAANSEAVILRD